MLPESLRALLFTSLPVARCSIWFVSVRFADYSAQSLEERRRDRQQRERQTCCHVKAGKGDKCSYITNNVTIKMK